MKYKIIINKKIEKTLLKLHNPEYSKIQKSIFKLADNPRPRGYIKLKGYNAYRIRVGNYRIIYQIQDDILTVKVISLGHRKEIYKQI